MLSNMASNYKSTKNSEVVQREIENGKALVEYSLSGSAVEVNDLLQKGASVNAEDYNRNLFYKSQNYMTPLQCAAKGGHTECVKVLLEYGADLNASDRFDVTAVHLAAEHGHLECLQLLSDAGAECNIATKYAKQGSYSAVPDIGGTTPLHLATRGRHIDCIQELIMNGADYNLTDEQGRTSLYIAAELGFEDAVLTHLNNAIGRDILSLPISGTRETPLHECVRHGMKESVRELLRHGSDSNHRNLNGYSPLHLSVQNMSTFSFDIVRELVTMGYNTNVNLRDFARTAPLQYVCFGDNCKQERRPQVAAFLIAYGAQFANIKNKYGNSLLQQELRTCSPDNSILLAMVRTLSHLPSLESLGISFSPRVTRLRAVPAEKCRWYHAKRSKPRSLQHLCRCTVREALGVLRLRNIRELPLPTPLKEYLLLEFDLLQ